MAADASTREELLGRLLAVPLERFVEQRNRLARELRDSGDRASADWLAKLRRPAPGIWALDQMARGDARRVRALLDLGAELGAVQQAAMRGDREAAGRMRELGGRLQRAVDDVVRRAAELLRDAGHGVGTEVALGMASTLRGVLAGDEEARTALAEGRLLEPVEEGGFGFGQMATAAPPASATPTPAAAPASKAAAEAERRRLAELRRAAEKAGRTAEAAERALAERRAEAERLRAEAKQLRTRIRALEEELVGLDERAVAAEAAAGEAQSAAREARRQADAAEAVLPAD